jgi:hypothetical protein
MGWLSVEFKNVNGRFRISDSDYIIKDGYLHAFSTSWPDGTVSHFVLNPSDQKVATWQTNLSKAVDALPKFKFGVASLVIVGGGLVIAGPAGAAAGATGIFLKGMHDLWNNWHPHETKVQGYYELETGDPSGNFKSPIRISDIRAS